MNQDEKNDQIGAVLVYRKTISQLSSWKKSGRIDGDDCLLALLLLSFQRYAKKSSGEFFIAHPEDVMENFGVEWEAIRRRIVRLQAVKFILRYFWKYEPVVIGYERVRGESPIPIIERRRVPHFVLSKSTRGQKDD